MGRFVRAGLPALLAILVPVSAFAAFAPPFPLQSPAATMAAVQPLTSGPETIVLWNVNQQFSYTTRTAGVWAPPAPIPNAQTGDSCCVAMHSGPAGSASMVYSLMPVGTFTSDYSGGAPPWTPVAQIPSVPPPFSAGFSAFVANAAGDGAVIGAGQDLRAMRRVAGSSIWGLPETIPTPSLANTSFVVDNAAIGAGGDLVVSYHSITTGCSTRCITGLYAATEGVAGGGWTLSQRFAVAGNTIQSMPIVDTSGHAGLVWAAQYGTSLELRTTVQSTPTSPWVRRPAIVVTQPILSGGKRTSLSLVGAETDADGLSTVAFQTGVAGTHGVNLQTADGSIVTNLWSAAATVAGPALIGFHFASNAVGGIALAWDVPNAPIDVLVRPATGSGWNTLDHVGVPHCANHITICTQVLSLSLDDSGVQRIVFNDISTSPGAVFVSQSF